MNTEAQKFSEGHSSLSDHTEKAVYNSTLNLNHQLRKEISVKVEQIMDPNDTVQDIDKAHCRKLAELYRAKNQNYACGIMKVYVSSTADTDGAAYATAVHNFYGKTFPKDGCCMVSLDSRLRRRSVQIIQDEDGMDRVSEPVLMP